MALGVKGSLFLDRQASADYHLFMHKRVMMVAGEASGDLHGADLAKELRALLPETEIFGMGGVRMAEQGIHLLARCAKSSVVGSVEVLGSAGAIAQSFRRLHRALKSERPDLLILIDFPDFNLLLGRFARREKIPIIYYISPQIWAWRPGRIKTIRRLVDQMLVILPFEEELYRRAGVDVHFVGHPLLDQTVTVLSREEFRLQLGVLDGRRLIGLMPGSRSAEVLRHLPLMLKAALLLRREDPELEFVISQANSIDDETMGALIPPEAAKWRIWKGRSCDLMNAADLLIVASGTVTLEASILGIPMVIIYSLSWPSWLLGKLLVRVSHVGLVNLLLGREVVPELLQRAARPEGIAQVVGVLLKDGRRREAMGEELLSVRSLLGEKGASRRAAMHIAHFLESEALS